MTGPGVEPIAEPARPDVPLLLLALQVVELLRVESDETGRERRAQEARLTGLGDRAQRAFDLFRFVRVEHAVFALAHARHADRSQRFLNRDGLPVLPAEDRDVARMKRAAVDGRPLLEQRNDLRRSECRHVPVRPVLGRTLGAGAVTAREEQDL